MAAELKNCFLPDLSTRPLEMKKKNMALVETKEKVIARLRSFSEAAAAISCVVREPWLIKTHRLNMSLQLCSGQALSSVEGSAG